MRESFPNRLLLASRSLLDTICRLQIAPVASDWSQLQYDLQQSMKTLVVRATQEGYSNEVVLMARYILCATLDETLLHHSQLAVETWQPYCLLNNFPVEQLSQEQFFPALEVLREDPKRHIDILELIYLCFNLGFRGSYRTLPQEQTQLTQWKDEIFQLIKKQRGEVEFLSSAQNRQVFKPKTMPSTSSLKIGRTGLITLLFLGTLYAGFTYTDFVKAQNLLQNLAQILTGSSS